MGVQPDQAKIGDRIREARLSVGLKTQQAFADVLGVKMQSVSNWERGRTRVTPSRATQIEHVCNADRGYILTGEGYLYGGSPQSGQPTASEMELLRRVADLEREVSLLRSTMANLEVALTARRPREADARDSGTG